MQETTENNEEIREAVWHGKRRRFSPVWIVPIVALVIGAWLFYKSVSEKGPEIEILFKSAAGIKADKTVIKYKDIEVGKVTEVTFGDKLKVVKVKAELKKTMAPFLSENTRFWVMQAQLGAEGVQGLDTLLSGVYIVMDPQRGKEKTRRFKGLEKIPVIRAGEKGKTFMLKAKDIGSLSVGSPIYYKRLRAGTVASYKLDEEGRNIDIRIFVKSPFDKLINDKTRFYNASGISADLTSEGFKFRTESLIALLMGGLAFDNFPQLGRGKPVKDGHTYTLYDSREEAQKPTYTRELYFWIHFKDSVRGLSVGAPVELKGVKIGEVLTYSLVGNADTAEFYIPILIKVYPERFTVIGEHDRKGNAVDTVVFKKLVENGFRARLETGNLLTGELYVDLNFYPNVEPVKIHKENGYYVIPSMPNALESLKNNAEEIMKKVAKIPFEDIGKEIDGLLKTLHRETLPNVDKLIRDTNKMMNAARKNYFDSNAAMNKKMLRLIDELTRTSRSFKKLTDYLDRHPESLIKGR